MTGEVHPVLQKSQSRAVLAVVKGRQKRGAQVLDEPAHAFVTLATYEGKSVQSVSGIESTLGG